MPKMNLSISRRRCCSHCSPRSCWAIITKRTDRERMRYAAYCFGCFLAAIFGLSWLMYLGHG